MPRLPDAARPAAAAPACTELSCWDVPTDPSAHGPHCSTAPLALSVLSPPMTHLQSGPHGGCFNLILVCGVGDAGVVMWVSLYHWDCIAAWFLSSRLSGKYLFHLPGSIRRGLNSLHIPCPMCPYLLSPQPCCPQVQ